jgi:hypothetical protein
MGHCPEPPALLTTSASDINVNVYLTVSCSAFVLAWLKSLSLQNSIDIFCLLILQHFMLMSMQIHKHVNSKKTLNVIAKYVSGAGHWKVLVD